MSWESLLPGAPQSNFYDMFNRGREVAIADQTQKRQAQEWQRQDAQHARDEAILANRQSIAPLLAQGDYAGAQKAALSHGDLDYYGRIGELQKSNAAIAAQHGQTIAQAADTLLQVPQDQRAAVFTNTIKPQLKGLGITDSELGQVQLDDHSLQAYRAFGVDLKTRMELSKPTNVPMEDRLVSRDPITGVAQVLLQGQPKLQNVTATNRDGSTTNAPFNPFAGTYGRYAVNPPAGGAPASGGAPAASGGAPAGNAAPGGDSGFDRAMGFTLPHEGGYNSHDTNGHPVNFGINQGANPDIDVAKLTRDGAKQVYFDRYWKPSGAANLPANMQVPFFDTYIINPSVAQRLLAASGNDPAKFMDLREAWQNRLLAADPGKYGVARKAWTRRNADLRSGGGVEDTGSSTSGGSTGGDPYSFTGSTGGGGLDVKNAPTGYAWNKDRTGLEPIKGGPQDDAGSTNPQSVHDDAVVLIKTGQMPSLGIGGADYKKAVLDKRSELLAAAGIDASQLPAFRADYDAHKATLKQRTELLGSLKPNADTLDRNLAQVLQTHQRLVDLGVIGDHPATNGAWISYYKNFGTHEQKAAIAAAEQATTTAANEYAAFMTKVQGGGNAPSSDASRNEAHERIPITAGPDGMHSGIAQLKTEARNKIIPYQESAQAELAALRRNPLMTFDGNAGGAPASRSGGAPAGLPPGSRMIGTHGGKPVYQLPNGKKVMAQ